jgi:hypothetical protein
MHNRCWVNALGPSGTVAPPRISLRRGAACLHCELRKIVRNSFANRLGRMDLRDRPNAARVI